MDYINDAIKELESSSREIQLEISDTIDNIDNEVSESEIADHKKYLKLLKDRLASTKKEIKYLKEIRKNRLKFHKEIAKFF